MSGNDTMPKTFTTTHVVAALALILVMVVVWRGSVDEGLVAAKNCTNKKRVVLNVKKPKYVRQVYRGPAKKCQTTVVCANGKTYNFNPGKTVDMSRCNTPGIKPGKLAPPTKKCTNVNADVVKKGSQVPSYVNRVTRRKSPNCSSYIVCADGREFNVPWGKPLNLSRCKPTTGSQAQGPKAPTATQRRKAPTAMQRPRDPSTILRELSVLKQQQQKIRSMIEALKKTIETKRRSAEFERMRQMYDGLKSFIDSKIDGLRQELDGARSSHKPGSSDVADVAPESGYVDNGETWTLA